LIRIYPITATHELTHAIKMWSPAKYKMFQDFLLENYAKKGVSMDKLVALQIEKAAAAGRTLSADEALEEVVADSCESFLADGDALSKIAELRAKDEGLWKKIKSEIKKLLDKIRSVYKGLQPDSTEGRYVKGMQDTLEALHKLWTEALLDAGRTHSVIGFSNADDSTYSPKKAQMSDRSYFVEDKYFKSVMSDWENLKHGSYVKVGMIGDKHPLHVIGMPVGILRYDVDKLKKNMSDHGDYLTIDLLNAVPEIISNPVAISEYRQDKTVSVFGDIFVGNSPMMVGVTISNDRAGNDICKVRTYNTRRDVGNLITNETILYLGEDKKRTRKWFQACGIQVPLGGNKFGYIRSISQDSDSVNRQFSERNPILREERQQIEKLLASENATLREDNQRLKELVKLQSQMTHGTRFTNSSVDTIAKMLMQYAGSKGNRAERTL